MAEIYAIRRTAVSPPAILGPLSAMPIRSMNDEYGRAHMAGAVDEDGLRRADRAGAGGDGTAGDRLADHRPVVRPRLPDGLPRAHQRATDRARDPPARRRALRGRAAPRSAAPGRARRSRTKSSTCASGTRRRTRSASSPTGSAIPQGQTIAVSDQMWSGFLLKLMDACPGRALRQRRRRAEGVAPDQGGRRDRLHARGRAADRRGLGRVRGDRHAGREDRD